MEHSLLAAYADMDEMRAHVHNALFELAQLRSDIVSELGHNPNDSHLKAAFLDYAAAIHRNLLRALA